jgi:hypothetical protein
VPHRLGQVVQQLVQILAEAVDGFAFQAKAGVTEQNDRSDTHGRRVYRGAAQRHPADS